MGETLTFVSDGFLETGIGTSKKTSQLNSLIYRRCVGA